MSGGGEEFEYDVAFSFLAGDENIAVRLAAMLGDRYTTFVYSEHQKDLAGRDGEEKFAEVFGRKARVVVILYRPEWGETKWTRIEQTAIRNRAHDQGYDFTLWVPLQEIPGLPAWFPKTRLYYGLSRFGDTGLTAVIDQLLQQQGRNVKPESLAERAARMQKEVALVTARRELIEGYDRAVADKASASARAISDAVAAWAAEDSILKPQVRRQGDTALLLTVNRAGKAPLCMTLTWTREYANHLGAGARYTAQAYEGTPQWPGLWVIEEAKTRKALKFKPDLNSAMENCWVPNGEQAELSPVQVADRIIRFLMDEMVAISGK